MKLNRHGVDRSAADEQHYTPAEVGELWGFSAQSMIRLFENEPGVVVLGTRTPRNGKQRRMFLRIPKSVMERKHEELVCSRQRSERAP